MQALIVIMFISASVAEFLVTDLKAPAPVKFIPEMLSVLVVVAVILLGVRRGFGLISAKYWGIFGVILLIMVCGILSNAVGSGPIVSGARYYLRAMPFFILPAVYPFTDKQLQQQMKVVLALALLQVPIALYQRWIILSSGRFSGDGVYGTMLESGVLSLVLISIVFVLTGQLLRKRIGVVPFIVLFFLLLVPTTINETKVTVILLPIGLLTTIVAASPPGKRLPIFLGGITLLLTFAAIFVPIYDYMNRNSPYKQGRTLEDFFTDQKQMAAYMESQKQGAALGMKKDVRRGDALEVPFRYMARDPIQLVFGLGIGNASHSNLGQAFTGAYNGLFDRFLITSVTIFLLEIGVFGTALIFALYWFLFFDTLAVAKADTGVVGSIAAGWIGVVAIMPAATFYQPIHAYSSISYLFWFFSGVIVARRMQLLLETQRSPLRERLPRATA